MVDTLQEPARRSDTYSGMLFITAAIYAFATGIYYLWLTKHAEQAGHASFLYATKAEETISPARKAA